MKIFMFLVLALTSSCGGSSSTQEDQQDTDFDVSGIYSCSLGCSGTCDFSNEIEVDQLGNSLTFFTDDDILRGSINQLGRFSVSDDFCDCFGDIADERATVDCECLDIQCQIATYDLD